MYCYVVCMQRACALLAEGIMSVTMLVTSGSTAHDEEERLSLLIPSHGQTYGWKEETTTRTCAAGVLLAQGLVDKQWRYLCCCSSLQTLHLQ